MITSNSVLVSREWPQGYALTTTMANAFSRQAPAMNYHRRPPDDSNDPTHKCEFYAIDDNEVKIPVGRESTETLGPSYKRAQTS